MGFFADILGTLRSTFKVGQATFSSSGLTAARSFALPDLAGTLALASQIGGATFGIAELNFGTGGNTDTSIAVTGQTGIAANTLPIVRIAYSQPTADHSSDEHLVERINVIAGNVIAGVGFTIYGVTQNTSLFGRWNVAWSY